MDVRSAQKVVCITITAALENITNYFIVYLFQAHAKTRKESQVGNLLFYPGFHLIFTDFICSLGTESIRWHIKSEKQSFRERALLSGKSMIISPFCVVGKNKLNPFFYRLLAFTMYLIYPTPIPLLLNAKPVKELGSESETQVPSQDSPFDVTFGIIFPQAYGENIQFGKYILLDIYLGDRI